MKRMISILALVLCFCLAASCGTQDLLSQMTGGQSQTDAAAASGTDADDAAAPSAASPADEEPATGTDSLLPSDAQPQTGISTQDLTEGSTDFSALTAEECVEDAMPEPLTLPRITIDCPGAELINQQIQDTFFSVAEDPLWELDYQCAKGAGHILSIVMKKHANDWMEHTVYHLDMSTGQALSTEELLAMLHVDTDELANLEQAILGEEFTHQYGGPEIQQDREFYEQQYARTTSPDNVELEKIWFGGDGQLYFAGRIYPLAGPEYSEYQLPTGMVF